MTVLELRTNAVLAAVAALTIATAASAIPEGPAPGTPEWTQREAANYAKNAEAPNEQAQNPDFQTRWHEQSQMNQLEWLNRALADRQSRRLPHQKFVASGMADGPP